jgi:hypothetical protein
MVPPQKIEPKYTSHFSIAHLHLLPMPPKTRTSQKNSAQSEATPAPSAQTESVDASEPQVMTNSKKHTTKCAHATEGHGDDTEVAPATKKAKAADAAPKARAKSKPGTCEILPE